VWSSLAFPRKGTFPWSQKTEFTPLAMEPRVGPYHL
jgi:hypothetical protein